MRISLGRIADELQNIVGVIDSHLEATVVPPPKPSPSRSRTTAQRERTVASPPAPEPSPPEAAPAGPRPAEVSGPRRGPEREPGPARQAFSSMPLRLLAFVWAMGGWAWWAGVFALDTGIVVGMQVFLESIGRRRGSIMGRRHLASAIAAKAGGAIPRPLGSVGRESAQRLSVLSQEELLAACLTEHWGKVAAGMGLALLSRLPVHLLDNDGVLCHVLVNLAVMLRCMSLVMLVIRDDVALPKQRVSPRSALGTPSSPRRRFGE